MSQAVYQVMSATTEYSSKLKAGGYRRTESEPAYKTLHDIRSRFESTNSSDSLTTEFGLAFGKKKSVSSQEVSTSPTPTNKYTNNNINGHIPSSIGSEIGKLDKVIGKIHKQHTGIVKIQPRDKLVLGTMSSKYIGNSDISNQTTPDNDHPFIGLHNAGVLNINKLNQLQAPTTTSLPVWSRGLHKVASSDSLGSKSEKENSSGLDYVYTSKVDSKLQSAKSFWSKKSQECDPVKTSNAVELGTDYSSRSKCIDEKGAPLTTSNLKKVDKNSNHEENGHRFIRMTSVTSEETRSNRSTYSLSKSPSQSSIASSIEGSELEYVNVHNFKLPRRTNSKPPHSIVARRTQMFEKSLDDMLPEETEAYKKMKDFGTVFKSKDSEPSAPASPRTTRSSADSALLLQNKLKQFPKSDASACVASNEKLPSESVAKSSGKLSKVDRLSDKPVEQFQNSTSKEIGKALKPGKLNSKAPKKEKPTTSEVASKTKPLPFIPVGKKPKNVDKGKEMFNLIAANNSDSSRPGLPVKPSKDGSNPPVPPPKPPRTFVHKSASSDNLFNEPNFDPIVIPRQAGDGQETDNDDELVSCQTQKINDSASLLPDNKLYTSATPSEPRPYTSLTMNEGSGGDDSLYGSENAYDTLGRSSAASSYDHYDTISQSELDSDLSRPPTLPRRPSNLRHSRPLTTAFSHLDINKPNSNFHNQLQKALITSSQTIKETSPTSPSPTKIKVPFKLKYLLPKTKRKEDMKKAASLANLTSDSLTADSLYDTVEILPPGTTLSHDPDEVPIDESGYALPEIKGHKKFVGNDSQANSNRTDKNHEKIRLKLNQAFSAIRKVSTASTHTSDGEDDERPPDPEVLEERLKHCCSVKEHAIYASAEQIKGFMTRVYAQLYDYAVIISLRKNPDSNVYEPYVKFKFPPQVNVEQTTVPQFCFPDAHIWHKCTDYKSEAFSFVLTDVTGTRQYGYCRRMLPPDLNNLPRVAEVICVVSPLNATKFYNQLLDEVERRRIQSSIHAEEFLQAVYGRPMPSPGQSVTIRAMNIYEEPESLVFTRSPDAQREGIEYECLLNLLSVSQIVKIFASMLLERKIIFIAEKLSTLSSCVHAFVSLIYPFSWQHTFIPLLPPNLIDVVCAPTPFIVGLLSANFNLLNTLDDEMDQVLVVDLDNHKFLQRMGDEKTILPKKLHRALVTALDMAKSESQSFKTLMVSEAFLRFFLETTGSFNEFMIHVPGEGRQFQKEEFVCNAANAPSIMAFLQWFTETQMFEVYSTERENDRNVISGTFEERVFEFKSENHDEQLSDNRKFKKFKLFGKKGKK